ncbi:hypothetical protein HDR60_03240 [bacterium]|nr:hypothetical protein [bacterium]
MADSYDYLTEDSISSQDKSVLKNLSSMGEKLKELQCKMLETQAAAELAKKEYEHYAHVILPQEMFSAGVDSIGLSSGGSLKIKHNFYCQPNKNLADRKKIVEWLRANGGEHLVNHDATVSASDMSKLSDNGIPFVENTVVNTSSLKAFLKDKIGATTGVQQIDIKDIPECIHFQEVTTVELEV